MQLFKLVLILTFNAFLIVSCGGDKKAETSPKAEKEMTHQHTAKPDISLDMLTTTKDVACGMELTQDMIADTAVYKGQLYGFCCEECKAAFKAKPDSLIALYMEQEK
ncbi:MAG: hypothetical protein Kow0037_09540 [Calditrichia bacterium]